MAAQFAPQELMSYYHHPLLDLASPVGPGVLPAADMTPRDFISRFHRSNGKKLKLGIGNTIYPIKNKIERRSLEVSMINAGVSPASFDRVNLMTKGDRGFGNQLYLKEVARRVGRVDMVGCFGCGVGDEMLEVARFLRPRRIVGYEYLNYEQAWTYATELLAQQGIEAQFLQCDLRNPVSMPVERADILLSFAVLEHLHSLDDTFKNLRPLLKNDGWFSAIWGPLWYTFSGDHIAGELGFEHGYDHVVLTASEYIHWYSVHPRNADAIRRGEGTWLDMGLISFAQYAEYIDKIEQHFGAVGWLAWAISSEGLVWRVAHRKKWERMLLDNPHIGPLDLLLKSVAILVRSSAE